MIHAVTFDFWETLVHDSAENMRDQRMLRIGAVHRVLGRAGRMLGLADVVDAYDRSEQVLVERFWSRDRDPAIAEQVRLVLETASPGAPGVILRRVLERHDLLRHFMAISYSDEVGYRKPDAEIFRRTLAELGIEASDAAHVGDNPIADVQGAQAAGMRGVHYAAAGRPGASHADLIVADLGDLADRLAR